MFNFHSDASGIETQANFAVVFVVFDFVSFRKKKEFLSSVNSSNPDRDWEWNIDSFIWISDKMNLCWTRKLSYYLNGQFYILIQFPAWTELMRLTKKMSARWTVFNAYTMHKQRTKNMVFGSRFVYFIDSIDVLIIFLFQRSNG